MTRDEVVNLMKSSKSEEEWSNNADEVKKAFARTLDNGSVIPDYPNFWFQEIVLSGIMNSTVKSWK